MESGGCSRCKVAPRYWSPKPARSADGNKASWATATSIQGTVLHEEKAPGRRLGAAKVGRYASRRHGTSYSAAGDGARAHRGETREGHRCVTAQWGWRYTNPDQSGANRDTTPEGVRLLAVAAAVTAAETAQNDADSMKFDRNRQDAGSFANTRQIISAPTGVRRPDGLSVDRGSTSRCGLAADRDGPTAQAVHVWARSWLRVRSCSGAAGCRPGVHPTRTRSQCEMLMGGSNPSTGGRIETNHVFGSLDPVFRDASDHSATSSSVGSHACGSSGQSVRVMVAASACWSPRWVIFGSVSSCSCRHSVEELQQTADRTARRRKFERGSRRRRRPEQPGAQRRLLAVGRLRDLNGRVGGSRRSIRGGELWYSAARRLGPILPRLVTADKGRRTAPRRGVLMTARRRA